MTKVMIVDDAAFMRASIRRMIESQDYEVVAEAADGIEAIEKYKKFKPDLITMDITMPNMTGIEALKGMRGLDKEVRVVMVSAMGQEKLIKEAVINGASSFIVKPFQSDKLLQVLNGITK